MQNLQRPPDEQIIVKPTDATWAAPSYAQQSAAGRASYAWPGTEFSFN
jgi:hypothetical protein